MQKKALITGITGQDGSYLAELLLGKGYQVYGMHRRTSTPNLQNIAHILNRLNLVSGEMTDGHSLTELVKEIKPDELYNLAAQSHVKISESQPTFTWETNAFGVVRLLEAIKKYSPQTKLYQASTSEMFGNSCAPQNEQTPFDPKSPYAEAKKWAHEQVKNYRTQGLFAVSGILFNHESPRRGLNFVTRKITSNLAKIAAGKIKKFELGNFDAKRDWGFAGDYVCAMHLMLQKQRPDDYVIATGETHTVRDFILAAAQTIGMRVKFEGTGVNEKVIWIPYEHCIISVDPKYFRQNEVNYLLGDASKAKKELGWTPATKFYDLVEMMVNFEIKSQKE